MELLTVPPLLCYRCSWTATKTNSKSSISPPEHLQWLQMGGRHRDPKKVLSPPRKWLRRSRALTLWSPGELRLSGSKDLHTYSQVVVYLSWTMGEEEKKRRSIIYCSHSRTFSSSQTNSSCRRRQTDESLRRQNFISTMDFSLSRCVSIMCEIYLRTLCLHVFTANKSNADFHAAKINQCRR